MSRSLSMLLLVLMQYVLMLLAANGEVCAASAKGSGSSSSGIPFFGRPGTVLERSLFAIKPDGIERGLVGDIIKRFERKGLKLVAMKLVHPTEEQVTEHYAEHEGKPFFAGLVKYFCSGPVIMMVWEGPDAIAGGRQMLGKTNPMDADVGTIRGDFCISSSRNIVHASDAPSSAEREIKLWFNENEVVTWHRQSEDTYTGIN